MDGGQDAWDGMAMEDLKTVFALPVTATRLATAPGGYQTSQCPCRFHWPISSTTMNLNSTRGPGVCYEITFMYNVYSCPLYCTYVCKLWSSTVIVRRHGS